MTVQINGWTFLSLIRDAFEYKCWDEEECCRNELEEELGEPIINIEKRVLHEHKIKNRTCFNSELFEYKVICSTFNIALYEGSDRFEAVKTKRYCDEQLGGGTIKVTLKSKQ